MRYAVVSDIHANLTAWQTVLNDIADMRVDQILCLGDVVGYGPQPVEVLESVYQRVQVTLQGNHDAAVCGLMDPALFSQHARTAVLRHRTQISEAGLAWLRGLPLLLTAPGFRCVHGDFSDPEAFLYISEPEDALPSWQATVEPLLFAGHSHQPGVHVLGASGVPHLLEPCDFEIETGKRYIVNPGSVGYPRQGHFRSTYCLYDDVTRTIVFRQLPFDSDAYRAALRTAGLADAPWLAQQALRRYRPDVRVRRSFAKANPVQRPTAKRSPSHLAARLLVGTALALLACALLPAMWRSAPPALAIEMPPYELPVTAAYPLVHAGQSLLPTLPETFAPDQRIAGWRYAFEDRTRQSFGTGLRDGAITLCIRNQGTGRVMLESALIDLSGTEVTALRLAGRVRKPEPFAGRVSWQVITYRLIDDNTLIPQRTFYYDMRSSRRRLTPPAAERNVKVPLPRHVTHVRFRMEATFSGLLEIEQPRLTAEPERSRIP